VVSRNREALNAESIPLWPALTANRVGNYRVRAATPPMTTKRTTRAPLIDARMPLELAIVALAICP